MTILLSLFAVSLACFVIAQRIKYSSELDVPFLIVGVITAITFFLFLIAVPLERMDTLAGMAKVEATRIAFEESRKSGDNVERYTRLDEIISVNQWLAKEKYYNNSAFDLWVPDEIESIQPIK